MIVIIDSKLMAYNISYNAERAMSEMFIDIKNILSEISTEVKEPISKIVLAFDYGKSSFRQNAYPDYKGGRSYHLMPSDFQDNYRHKLPKLAEALGINVIGVEGVEADDLAGILVSTYLGEEKLVLLSGDRDWLQLTISNPKVRQYDPKQHRWLTTECKSVQQFLIEKTIKGDTSDNIFGVFNCGEVAYKEFAKVLEDKRAYIGPEDKQKEFIYKEYLEFCASNKRFDIHHKYKKLGITTWEALYVFNMTLGEIFSDYKYLTAEQVEALKKEFEKLRRRSNVSSTAGIQSLVKEMAGDRTTIFGDTVTLPMDVIAFYCD